MYTLPPYPPIHLPATFTKTSLGVHHWIGFFQQSRDSLGLRGGHYCSHGAPGLELGEWLGGVSLVLRLIGASMNMVWELFLLESMQISTSVYPIIDSLCFFYVCTYIHLFTHIHTYVFAYLLAQDMHIQSVAGRYIYLSYICVINIYVYLSYFTKIFQPRKRPSTMCVFVAQMFATIFFWLEDKVDNAMMEQKVTLKQLAELSPKLMRVEPWQEIDSWTD